MTLTNRSTPADPDTDPHPEAAAGPRAAAAALDPAPLAPAPLDPAALDAVFQALAHPVRRGILEVLREGERTVGTLAKPFPLSRPAISQHLDVLERAGLIERIPSGRENRCRIRGAPMAGAVGWLGGYARYWAEAFDRMERHFLETPEPEEPEP
jgi:DNA-binding transcriptional ArsR family regulator